MTETAQIAKKSPPSKLTPMMQQWHDCKERAHEALLFFRLGDFYEAFYKDAEIISEELDLTLTKRQEVPMCGIPWHSSESYIDKLIAKGYSLAIAEQTEDPKLAKGLVKREIVRIITPATHIGSDREKSSNFFTAITYEDNRFGIAYIDLTTPAINVIEIEGIKEAISEIYRHNPKELLISRKFQAKFPELIEETSRSGILTVIQENWLFEQNHAHDLLKHHFSVSSLDGFGLKTYAAAISSSGALLEHLRDRLLLPIEHIREIIPHSNDEALELDMPTCRNLELFEAPGSQEAITLLDHLDRTKTAMGARMLKSWLQKPLIDVQRIEARQEAVQQFVDRSRSSLASFEEFTCRLKQIKDLERLMMRIKTGASGPRDYVQLRFSLEALPLVYSELATYSAPLIQELLSNLHTHESVARTLREALVDTPPLRVSDGGAFRTGYSNELDELYELKSNSTGFLANYQTKLREETGIKNLKVGFNRLFGYYIEISQSHLEKIPSYFQRRQTIANGERFITEELKTYESKILSADERIEKLEAELFAGLKKEIEQHHSDILKTCRAIASIDALQSLADVACTYKYIRPKVDNSQNLHIIGGRHPIIEHLVSHGQFVPNDLEIGSPDLSLILLTGPNMAGKSTYIRQAALLIIMAQIGSFIPAQSAHIGVIDRLFSRIGASDDLARGQSTFMVEMAETAAILRRATSRSFVILDEIGRGTSTYDGISIAWAVAEFLNKDPRRAPKTLFATHYYELTELEKNHPGVKNYTVAISETEGGIRFLRKVIRGSADRSYGIHVAKLAGLPTEVLKRAEEILHQLESSHAKELDRAPKPLAIEPPQKNQETLFRLREHNPASSREHAVLEKIAKMDLAKTAPIDAFIQLVKWQKELKNLNLFE